MKKNTLFAIICIAATQFFATSCLQQLDVYVKVPADKFFDFNLSQKVNVTIDYGFKGKNYQVLFELYDQNPIEENDNNELVKKNIEPVYRATTDKDGKFTGEIQTMSALSEVWLYSEYPGTLSPIQLKISDGQISYNQTEYVQKANTRRAISTRATTPNKHSYPDGWMILGDWNDFGTPDYLTPGRVLPDARTLYNINQIFVKYDGTAMQDRTYGKQFFGSNYSSEVKIIKPTKVYLCFINSSAAWKNTVGYFHYPTGKEPASASEITKIMAFPAATHITKDDNTGALVSGDRVLLKYWDGTKYLDEFPAGVTIGWWMQGMGFQTGGNVNLTAPRYERYSLPHLNSDGVQRCVSLKEPDSNQIVAIGFEDNKDYRYNDATFYLEIEKRDAIEDNIPSIPDVGNPPSNQDNYVTYTGTLSFEDYWPSMGDYDMNDIMIDYKCKVYKNTINSNSVYKLVNEFKPRYNEFSQLQSGFGFQLSNLSPTDVNRVIIDGAGPTQYMEGNTLEPGQSHPTILLFDNPKDVIGKTITVTIEVNDLKESNVMPPYNPFIYIESDLGRGKELHLPKYLPTDKMDMSVIGTKHDVYRPEEGLYYMMSRWNNQFPFALNLVGVSDFPTPVEGVRIDKAYPRFKDWVNSEGKNHKDWYKYPAE